MKPQGSLKPDKAWLLGFLAGDGCIAARRGRGINTDQALIDLIVSTVRAVYGVDPSVGSNRGVGRDKPLFDVFLCLGIVKDLHSLGTWGIYEWSVPATVVSANAEVHAAYLRGFFDAEGTVYIANRFGKNHHRVAASSANEQALREIEVLLNGLGIGTGFYETPCTVRGEVRIYHKVQVHKRECVRRFADLVGFESPGKLKEIGKIHDLPPVPKKGDVFRARLERIESLGLSSAAAPRVAAAVGCSVKQVWDARRWAGPLGAKDGGGGTLRQ